MIRKLTIVALRNILRDISWNQLDISMPFFNADGYLKEITNDNKENISKCFPMSATGRLKMADARKYITEIQSLQIIRRYPLT